MIEIQTSTSLVRRNIVAWLLVTCAVFGLTCCTTKTDQSMTFKRLGQDRTGVDFSNTII